MKFIENLLFQIYRSNEYNYLLEYYDWHFFPKKKFITKEFFSKTFNVSQQTQDA